MVKFAKKSKNLQGVCPCRLFIMLIPFTEKSVGLSNTPAEGVQDIFYIFVTQSCVEGESEFVFVHLVSIGVVFDAKAKLLVCCEQGQRLEVNIADNTVLSHSFEECVTIVFVFSCEAYKVEVTAAAVIL